MSQAYGPLQGVKVVSCSTAQAGTVPYMLMADLGADVIKIEVPEGGDGSRRMTVLPGMPSTFFETNNRGVKSVTLNLKTPEGKAILHKLVAKADIFGQNFRPGAAEKNGFGYEELRKVNPKLVYISISGYGPKGPHADLPGTDSMAQALGGIASRLCLAAKARGEDLEHVAQALGGDPQVVLSFTPARSKRRLGEAAQLVQPHRDDLPHVWHERATRIQSLYRPWLHRPAFFVSFFSRRRSFFSRFGAT